MLKYKRIFILIMSVAALLTLFQNMSSAPPEQPIIFDRKTEAVEENLPDCILINHYNSSNKTTKFIRESCKFQTPPKTVRNLEIIIDRSDVTLDCNGNIFDGQKKLAIGINIFNSSIGDADGIPSTQNHNFVTQQNVLIKNCTVRNFFDRGISIWVTANGAYNHGLVGSFAKKSRNSKNIKIKNSVIENSGSGVYFSFADDSEVSNSIIQNNAAMGIYLEAGTVRNKILNNKFILNGHEKSREALSIDGSSYNLIEGNTFSRNKEGGIFIYRNSWEHVDKLQTSPRDTISSGNVINRNSFENMPVGVWVASRQSTNYASHSLEWGEASPYFGQRSQGKEYYFGGIIKTQNTRETINTENTGNQKFLIDIVDKTTITNNIFNNITGITYNGAAVAEINAYLSGKTSVDKYGLSKTKVKSAEASKNATKFFWPGRVIDNKISDSEFYPFFIHALMIEGDFTFVGNNTFISSNLSHAPIGVKTAYRSTINLPLKYNYIVNNTWNNNPITEQEVVLRGDDATVISTADDCQSLLDCVKKYAPEKLTQLGSQNSCVSTDYITGEEAVSTAFTADSCFKSCQSKRSSPFGKCVYNGYKIVYNMYQKSFGSCQVISKTKTKLYSPDNLNAPIERHPRLTKMNVDGLRLCHEECSNLAEKTTYLDENKNTKNIKGGWTCFYGGYKIRTGFIK